jgi:hypothetical protein
LDDDDGDGDDDDDADDDTAVDENVFDLQWWFCYQSGWCILI